MTKLKIAMLLILCNYLCFINGQQRTMPAFEFLSGYPAVRDITISGTGDEAYFTLQNLNFDISVIASLKKIKGEWSEPSVVWFSGKFRDLEPFLSTDGLRLYFSSDRPLSDTLYVSKDFDIWYVERKSMKDKWSAPINLGTPVNTQSDEFYPSVAQNRNLYFTCDCPSSKGHDDIFVSHWDKTYKIPISLDTAINTAGYEFNAFIAPDESFIVYTGYERKGSYGSGDLYISFRNKDGIWEKSQNLGKVVNSRYLDYCPFMDIKTGILYFTSNRFSPEKNEIKSLDDYLKEVNKYENGASRIYKVSINQVLKTKKVDN